MEIAARFPLSHNLNNNITLSVGRQSKKLQPHTLLDRLKCVTGRDVRGGIPWPVFCWPHMAGWRVTL